MEQRVESLEKRAGVHSQRIRKMEDWAHEHDGRINQLWHHQKIHNSNISTRLRDMEKDVNKVWVALGKINVKLSLLVTAAGILGGVIATVLAHVLGA